MGAGPLGKEVKAKHDNILIEMLREAMVEDPTRVEKIISSAREKMKTTTEEGPLIARREPAMPKMAATATATAAAPSFQVSSSPVKPPPPVARKLHAAVASRASPPPPPPPPPPPSPLIAAVAAVQRAPPPLPPAAAAAVATSDHGTIEDRITQMLNYVRTDPYGFAVNILEPHLSYFDGMLYSPPRLEMRIQTREGAAAVQECIDFLRSAQPVSPLVLDQELCRAAQDHAVDIGPHGKSEHIGSDQSTMSDRMDRYGEWQGTCGENISLGYDDAQAIVLQMLVDDGIRNRGHRRNIMNDEFRVVGVALGPHSRVQHVCVMDFAGGFGQKVERLDHNESVTVIGEVTDRVQQILNSIPFDSIRDEVYIALQTRPEQKVTLTYTPSSIEAIFENPDGSAITRSGSWGVQSLDA